MQRNKLKPVLRLAIAGLAAVGFGGSATAETFQGALETALRSSPDLAAQYDAVRGLNEGVATARSGLRPSVTGSASAGYSFTDSSEAPKPTHLRPTSLNLTVTQPVFDGFQTQNAVSGAFEDVRSGRETLRGTQQTVLLNAIAAYIGVIQARENVALARNDLSVNRRSLQAARDRFNVGEVTRTDVAQAEASVASSQANLATQEGLHSQARETYLRQIGVMPDTLEPTPPLPPLPETLEEAREVARRNHPDILAARANVASAGFGVEEARGAILPQVDLQATGSALSESINRGSGVMSGAATVNVTVPLYQGGALRSQVRRGQALESQRYQQLRSVTRQILEGVGLAWEDLQTSKATIRANRAAVRSNQIALEGVREEAKVGSRTTLDVLEAQQTLLDSQVDLVNSRTSQEINAYALLRAMGVLSVDTVNVAFDAPPIEEDYEATQGYFVGSFDEPERPDDWLTNYDH
ncbi:MAG: TolC family outer membrane protein [Pseudomonadota bacterium]